MKNKIIVIAGGTGFIGTYMAQRWAAGNRVIILSRASGKPVNNSYEAAVLPANAEIVHWNGRDAGPWINAIEGADIVINLAGRSVNCRYNEYNKAEILNSRVQATQALGMAIAAAKTPPALWINVTSATIYRHAEDRPQDEQTGEIENDFSVQVCKAWEAAFYGFQLPATRQVALRSTIVLGRGGVMVPYARMTRFGLGGRQGSGKQMFSWIHIEDMCRMVEWLYETPAASGTYNAAAPNPVTNAAFMAAVRHTLNRTWGLPAPAWLLRLGAKLIGTETELLLKSRWVLPTRALQQGFTFRFPVIGAALHDVLL